MCFCICEYFLNGIILLLLCEFRCAQSSALLKYCAMCNGLVVSCKKDNGKVRFATG